MQDSHSKAIEELNSRIMENWKADSLETKAILDLQESLGLMFDNRPTCPFLRPHFLSQELYSEISRAANTIAAAEINLANAALANESLLETLELTEQEKHLVKIDPGYRALSNSSRFDTFVGKNGFKFLEYNAETPSGVGDQVPLEQVLETVPEVAAFLTENKHQRPRPHQKLLQSLFTSYREFGGKKSKPNIVIVDWDGVSTETEFGILKDYFESNGFKTLIVDPSELEYDGNILRAGSFDVDILYKRVLIHELLERCEANHPILRAYEDRNLCMCNSFRVKIPHKKLSFAILSDEKYSTLFTSEQLEMIQKHVPWTRAVKEEKTTYEGKEIDSIEFIRSQRESLLLKPNDDYGGKGIVLGWESTESEWDAAIAEALEDSFVVQERAEISKQDFPVIEDEIRLINLLVDFDPFLFQEITEGGMVRLSSSSLVNVTQGGGQTALIVLG